MESLPSDIVLDIVSRVPAESVFECKLVCKKWGTLIRGSNFTNMHLRRLLTQIHGGDDDGSDNLAAKVESCLFFACRIDDPDVERTLLFHGGQVSDIDEEYIYNQNLKRIYHPPMHEEPLFNHLVGSCNGLVCTFQHHHLVIDPIFICNPLTREYVHLPELVIKKEDVSGDRFDIEEGEVNMYGKTACGFGYVRSTNEYKVVRIHYLDYKEGNVEVYTLGSGCGWRAIGKVSHRLDMFKAGTGTYANDAIYWTAYNKVVAFDLAKEEFRLLRVPLCLQNRQNSDRCGLVALGGHLCLYMDKLRFEIWSVMKSSDSRETWRMELDIDYEAVVMGSRKRNFKPILLTKKGEIIFLYAESVLYCYDTKTTFLKMISDEASADYFEAVEVIAHVNTFASLEVMGENSKRYTVHPSRVRSPRDDDVIDELDRVALSEVCDTTRFKLRS
ncbi:F-box protein At3g07870-like [Papaver somniferum]|uniref:F-box protein At3g07870-like n=1 Tax=Papaver somniferum TaxID=3469 RepID=UPI000E70154D|nr:F-box protein At3g07870-like [Papaver somniferum]XP_026389035.1 F-box protein At3g07870-like [Papaver somniferum]XP_026389036.1 F-box protein At3g07870-like [Papaver somniferum]XP_026389038.1 F-box protein At3g07870-like [Papaver somniferum]XP_026389039.1 F-box protein At3g07870-like [Papaver somniferum]XP_026389040.1 F-box protein At3g07870-like [Papaver somniferum]XP_026389041.1 F-box protein At3g07870-like [Papaver somniferum]